MIGGSVYKITNTNNNVICYIGSTKRDINKRFGEHKHKSLFSMKPLYIYIRSIGINNFSFDTLYNSQFNNIVELREQEKSFIINLKPLFNKNIPTRTPFEYRRENRDIIRQYADERIECIYCKKLYPRNHKVHHEKTIKCLDTRNENEIILNQS